MCLSYITLLLIVASLTQIQSKCLVSPVGKLPAGCSIRNLTLINSHSRPLIDQNLCNSTVDQSLVYSTPQQIHFNHLTSQPASRYLLTAVDLTFKELLWMVSNLTLSNYGLIPAYNSKTQIIMPYRGPSMSSTSNRHIVEFLVFEEKPKFSSSSYYNNPRLLQKPFNLSYWMDAQQGCGITICGPVAGGSVVVFQQPAANTTAYPAYPPSSIGHPNYPSHNPHNSKRKNSAFHTSSNQSIMLLSVLMCIPSYLRSILD